MDDLALRAAMDRFFINSLLILIWWEVYREYPWWVRLIALVVLTVTAAGMALLKAAF